MKIKKIFIKNFKGIKEKSIIDFSSETSLLIGPNGFGKTTIFDVIELCLTGKIHRTYEKEHVTKHSSDYKKPFYQNTTNEDVVIKLWLEKETSESIIIVKFLDKNHLGTIDGKGRKNKPTEFGLLKTYTESAEDFEKETFDFKNKHKITSKEINDFFELKDKGLEIDKIYNLFNYLQQEETTYFLKKSETERKDALGFLFQTTNQELEMGKMNSLISALNQIKINLNSKIRSIEVSDSIESVSYQQLFENQEFEFDKEDFFADNKQKNSEVKKQVYLNEIDKLKFFLENFSPAEYKKKKNLRFLHNMSLNQDFIDYFILQNMLNKSVYEKLKSKVELVKNKQLQSMFVLQKHVPNYEEYQRLNEQVRKYKSYKEVLSFDNFSEKILELEKIIQDLMPDKIMEYSELQEEYETLSETLNELEKSIQDVVSLREDIQSELEKDCNHLIRDGKCPYCGSEWESFGLLSQSFEERGKRLIEISGKQSSKILKIKNKIKEDLIYPLNSKISFFLESHQTIEINILEKIGVYSEMDMQILTHLNSIPSIQRFIWDDLKTSKDLKTSVTFISQILEKELLIELSLFTRFEDLYYRSFTEEIRTIESLLLKENLDTFIIDRTQELLTESHFKHYGELFRNYLIERKIDFKYDNEKASDEEGLFNKYFNSQQDNFYKLTPTKVDMKKKYINYYFNFKQSSVLRELSKRENQISEVITRVEQVRDIYRKEITSYKKDMAENIKLPFYIYTAKMLQNYQQGMGVFLSTKNTSDSIRFITDPSTDHDVMHHLSSGQLSVISLAFTLAINKAYNISDNLKVLTIDDPIQDMDTLNIHSFIELIRHEFLREYQLILSTHSDVHALYMKYKLEKMKQGIVNVVHVQSEFFN